MQPTNPIPNSRRATSAARLLAAVAALPALVPAASAQTTLSWSSAGNSTLGGAGTWDTSAFNWWDGASAVAWPTTGTQNTAAFAGTAGTVSLGGAITANALNFSTTGYTLSGAQTLTLNGSTPTVLVSSGNTTIGGNTALILAGTSGLTKTGSGNLTLNSSSAHSFTGGLNVNGGALVVNLGNLATPSNLINSSNALSLSGGTINITGKAGASANQTFSGTSIRGYSVLTVNNTGTATTANFGTLSRGQTGGVVSFQNSGGTAFVSNTANSTIGSWALTGDPAGNSVRWAFVSASGQVGAASNNTTLGTNLSGVTSATTPYNITNSVNNTLSTDVTAFGLLVNNLNVSIATNGRTVTTDGILAINGTYSLAISGNGSVRAGGGNELVVAGPGVVNISANITNGVGGNSHLNYAGGSTLTLGGNNSFSGQTTVNGGTLLVNTSGNINNSSGVVINRGTFRYDNTSTALTPVTTLNGGRLTGVGNVTLGAVAVANNSGAIITNNNGAAGATLTVGDLTFNGAASLNLALNSTNAALAAGALSTNNAGVVTITPTFNTGLWTNNTTYNLVTYTGGSVGGAGFGQFALGTLAGLTSRQSSLLGNTGSAITLTVNGDSPTWIGGTNGDWNTTQAGNWRLVTAGTNTTFIQGDDVQFTDSVGSGTANINITENVSTTAILFNNNAVDYVIGSSGGFGVSSAVSVTKSGSGTVTLNSNNGYSGSTIINSGTLRAGSATAFGASANASLVFGSGSTGTVQLNGNSITIAGLTTNSTLGSPILENASATSATLSVNSTIANTYAGVLQDGTGGGSLGLAKLGGNVLTLSGNNSYTGVTAIGGTAGGIIVTANNALGSNAGNTTIAAGTALGLSGGVNYSTAETIVGSGLGTTTSVGPFASVQRGFVQSISGNNTFAGPISINATGISRIGTQTGSQLTLSGPITLASGVSGVTMLFRAGDTNGDFITLANSGNSWDTDTQLFSGNTGTGAGVRLGVDNALPTNVSVISSAASSGSGTTLDLAGFNQQLNGLNWSTGALTIRNSSSTATSVLTLDNAANSYAGNAVIADGAGKVQMVKSGPAAQTLYLPSTYTGGTIINNGSLILGNSTNTLSDTGAVTVSGGALDLWVNSDTVGAVTLTSGSIIGSGTLTGSSYALQGGSVAAALGTGAITVSTGTTTLDSAGRLNSASDLTITSGQLTIGGDESVAGYSQSGGILAGSGILTSASAYAVQAGAISAQLGGSVGFNKTGAGSATLSGANTFSGITTVSGGTLAIDNGGSIANTSGISVASDATFTNNSATGITKALTLGEGATINGTGEVTGAGVVYNADFANGFTSVSVGSSFAKGGEISFNLTNITDGNYALFTGTSIGGSFTSVRINNTALTGSGGVFSGMVNSLNYTYTDSSNLLTISSIPEPAAFATFAGLALLGCAGSRRRRR